MTKSSQQAERFFNHGLAFLALIGFIFAFSSARIFTTLNPSTVIETGGIHFHHFWYGLAMIVVAGWLGIIGTGKRYRRILAVVFGIGGGLVADELGLLLTLGNYHTPLTYPIVVGIIAVATIMILFFHSGKYVRQDLGEITLGDKIILVGIAIAGTSAIAFPINQIVLGIFILATGAAVIIFGFFFHQRK